MKEIDEKGVIEQLKTEREKMQKQMADFQIQARAIEEQINRLQFDLAKKQGAVEDFERLVLGKKPESEQKKTDLPLGKDEKSQ